ncbi:MAG: glycosyltransferase family 2 protein [Bacteroidales bacterium]|nr:glycosyltransferase family 2 protein [Bacteroidales bacterium]
MHSISSKCFADTAQDLKFSIIIPSWNNLDFLKLAVRSIRENSKYRHQIIVHVNEGIDGTTEWLNKQQIDYTYSEENIGICYALNYARQLVKTKFLVYMNDDMYVAPNWDVPFDEEIKRLPNQHFFLSATLIEAQTSNPCAIEQSFGSHWKDFDEDQFQSKCMDISFNDWHGATWPVNLVHIDLWDMVGGYSVEYTPGFYSDPDFSKKLWDVGVRYFKGLSQSRVYHFPSQSTKRIKKPNTGRKTFLLKWGMTSGYFFKQHLKMGTPFNGNLIETNQNKKVLHRIKSIIELLKH